MMDNQRLASELLKLAKSLTEEGKVAGDYYSPEEETQMNKRFFQDQQSMARKAWAQALKATQKISEGLLELHKASMDLNYDFDKKDFDDNIERQTDRVTSRVWREISKIEDMMRKYKERNLE